MRVASDQVVQGLPSHFEVIAGEDNNAQRRMHGPFLDHLDNNLSGEIIRREVDHRDIRQRWQDTVHGEETFGADHGVTKIDRNDGGRGSRKNFVAKGLVGADARLDAVLNVA